MKVTVWTKTYSGHSPETFRRSKCIAIYDDYKLPLPSKGMQVQIRDGGGYEDVESVMLDMSVGTAEVHLQTVDGTDFYGPSLL